MGSSPTRRLCAECGEAGLLRGPDVEHLNVRDKARARARPCGVRPGDPRPDHAVTLDEARPSSPPPPGSGDRQGGGGCASRARARCCPPMTGGRLRALPVRAARVRSYRGLRGGVIPPPGRRGADLETVKRIAHWGARMQCPAAPAEGREIAPAGPGRGRCAPTSSTRGRSRSTSATQSRQFEFLVDVSGRRGRHPSSSSRPREAAVEHTVTER